LHCLPSPLLDQMKLTGKLMVQLIPAASRQWKLAFPVQEADGTHQVEWSMKALSNVNNFWSSTLAEGGHPAAGRARHAVVNALTPRNFSKFKFGNNEVK